MPPTLSTSTGGHQESYNYHCVESLQVQRAGNRNSGCWTSSSVKLVQLCCMGILVPAIWILVPLYARFFLYTQSSMPLGVAEMLYLDSNISTVWCQGQNLHMNVSFDAFLMSNRPSLSRNTQKLSMTRHFVLDDDSKEYWGFYLLKGSHISVTACTRYLGGSLTIIKGKSDLRRCAYFDDESGENQIPHDMDSDLIGLARPDIRGEIQGNSAQLDAASNETGIADELADDRGTLIQPLPDGDISLSRPDEDLSYTSSSEESLKRCKGTLLHQPLIPDGNCDNSSDPEGNFVQHAVDEDGYYYFIFSSSFEQREKEENPMTVKFELLKTMFNMSEAVAVCRNTTDCYFPLNFASKQRVIVALPAPEEADDAVSSHWNDKYIIQSECDPRTPLYLTFGLSLPVLVILCAFL